MDMSFRYISAFYHVSSKFFSGSFRGCRIIVDIVSVRFKMKITVEIPS